VVDQQADGADRGRSLETPKLAQLIANEFRQDIVAGTRERGSSLPPETELAAQYRVSKPVAREAIRILEAEGLVSVRRGSHNGATVQRPDIAIATRHAGIQLRMNNADLRDVWLARAMVECEAVRIVANVANPERMRQLLQISERGQECAARGDITGYFDTQSEFQSLILEISGNKTMQLLHSMLTAICSAEVRMMNESFAPPEVQRRAQLAANATRRVVELMQTASPDEAEQFWRRHMTAIGDIIFELLGNAKVMV
jgi:DNA-binding FadR family transcriptional regulator